MAIEKDYIGPDPVVWVERLLEVNSQSQFTKVERAINQRHLDALHAELKRVCEVNPNA